MHPEPPRAAPPRVEATGVLRQARHEPLAPPELPRAAPPRVEATAVPPPARHEPLVDPEPPRAAPPRVEATAVPPSVRHEPLGDPEPPRAAPPRVEATGVQPPAHHESLVGPEPPRAAPPRVEATGIPPPARHESLVRPEPPRAAPPRVEERASRHRLATSPSSVQKLRAPPRHASREPASRHRFATSPLSVRSPAGRPSGCHRRRSPAMTSQAGRIRGWSGAAIPLARRRRTTARRPRRSPDKSNGGDGRESAPRPWCYRPAWLRRARSSSCGGPRSGPRRRRSERPLGRHSNGRRDRRWPPWPRSLPPPLSGPGGRRLGSRSQGRWPANRGRWGCCRSCPRGPIFARPRPRRRRAFRPARRLRRLRRAIRGQSLGYRRRPRRCQVRLRHRPSRRRCRAPASTTNSPAGTAGARVPPCRLTPRRVSTGAAGNRATTPVRSEPLYYWSSPGVQPPVLQYPGMASWAMLRP